MGARTATPAVVEVTEAQKLHAHAVATLQSADPSLRTFKSGNTGLYITNTLKGSLAREAGLTVPPGGKVKVQVTVIVVDPENSDN